MIIGIRKRQDYNNLASYPPMKLTITLYCGEINIVRKNLNSFRQFHARTESHLHHSNPALEVPERVLARVSAKALVPILLADRQRIVYWDLLP